MRAVPTELRWKTLLVSPPSAVVVCIASTGWSAVGRSSGGLTGGSPKVVSSSARRDNMPGVNGWAGRSPAAGCLPWASSRGTSASGAAAGTAAGSTGPKGRAKGATARRAANNAASQRCSVSPRCARVPTGTSVVSRARQSAAQSRRQSAAAKMMLATRSVKGHRRQRRQALRTGPGAPLTRCLRAMPPEPRSAARFARAAASAILAAIDSSEVRS